ncbi:MAG: hypothetical protein ACPLKP_03395 [Microgenomates group bacterium]
MKKLIVVYLISFLIAFLNIFQVVWYEAKTPYNTQYLAPDGHYPIDYFAYLISIAQGFRGKWQLVNLLTSENTPSYWVISWPYLLIGHFSRIFGLLPQFGYWIAVFGLTFLIIFITYFLIKITLAKNKFLVFPVFLIYIFAGPFWQINNLNPLKIDFFPLTWYYKTLIFSRLSAIPHHLFANLLILLFFLFSYYFFENFLKKIHSRKNFFYFLAITFVLVLIFSLTPIKITYLFFTFILTFIYCFFLHYRHKISFRLFFFKILFYLIPLGLLLLFFGLYFQKNSQGAFLPELKTFEKEEMEFPSLKNFLLGSGPLLILGIIAFWLLIFTGFNQISPFLFLGLTATFLSYLLFYTPFSAFFNNHNSRLLFGESYLFFSITLGLSLEKIALKLKLNPKKLIIFFLLFFTLFSLPAWYAYLPTRLETDPFFEKNYRYLPLEIIEGLTYLNTKSNSQTIILTPPNFLGLILPVFVEGRVFCGSPSGTHQYYPKALMAANFYGEKTSIEEKIKFLKENKIKYVIYVSPDLDPNLPDYISKNFSKLNLKLIFSNSKIKIFEF